MTTHEAIQTLRRMATIGRLPDEHDVRVADICVDVASSAEAVSWYNHIKQRHEIWKAERTREQQGPLPFVCPKCKESRPLRKDVEMDSEFCTSCRMHWDSGYFLGWNVGWREHAQAIKDQS